MKVLPEHVSHDAAALARFGREARSVAALSHPHIEALFDIGEADGTHYLVMELLEGETLASRLRRGLLPERDALRIGVEIAEALGAAHAAGIVHRDVKPANVMLTRSGVKLLDFGVARLQRRPGPSGETAATTELGDGGIAGTLPYMAPEQLEGRETDARTDIWALGCVLFEMLTGRRVFEGDSKATLIAAIEKDEALPLQPAEASPAVERLLQQCLQKNPEDRWQSARDLARRLREIAEAGPEVGPHIRTGQTRRLLVPAMAAAVVLAVLAGAVADRLWLRPAAAPTAGLVVRSSIDLPAGTAVRRPTVWDIPIRTELVLSPDGTVLVWSGAQAAAGVSVDTCEVRTREAFLYRRRLDTGETAPISGTENGSQPFFSPDGQWIGFWSKGKLRKVRVEGGVPVALADVPECPPMGAFWASGDRILLGALGRSGGLSWVAADGGTPSPLTTIQPAREVAHRLPWELPSGKALRFTAMAHGLGAHARVEALTLANGARKVLVDDAADGRYLPTGQLVFVRRGVLMAAPFDPDRLELRGPAAAVLDGVSQALNTGWGKGNSGSAQFAASHRGLLVYAAGGIMQDWPNELVLVDRAGHAAPVAGFDKPLTTGQARFSPDARRIAFVEKAISGRLWLFDTERKTLRALSPEGIAGCPLWSTDGARLIVAWSAAGPMSLWSVPVESGGTRERLTDGNDMPSSWSPDGRVLAFVRLRTQGSDILLYRFEDRQVVPFLATGAQERSPAFSPDGRWLAYVSDESGRYDVYATSFPDRRRTLVISTRGGIEPAWSRDGTELFYRAPGSPAEAAVMSVKVTHGETIRLGHPNALFPDSFDSYNTAYGYDVTPDGRRFLFARTKRGVTPLFPEPITRLELVHNWFSELERLCPTPR